jgi:hypothetical protein
MEWIGLRAVLKEWHVIDGVESGVERVAWNG